jgi:hypothetical protein
MTDLITLPRATVQQALEALEAGPDVDPIFAGETEVALRAALAQQGKEKPRSATSHIGTYYGRKNPALAQPRQFTFAPKPPSPPPAPQGYDGTEAGLHDFSWSNHV